MGLIRWLLWPRRAEDQEEARFSRGRHRRRPKSKPHHPGVYRIEVDGEAGRFHRDGPPFSFWSSSRVILILSFLLWWIQPAGPMIAGYVGGRRAGSPIKAIVAALMPVFAIYVANVGYAHNFAAHQVDFVASLPMVISDAASSILPFLVPYKEFMIAYMRGFMEALTTTFGMGTNGYLMVVIFAYIGGLIAEQTRRELHFRSGSGASLGVNLVQPILGARPYVDDEEAAFDDDEIPHSRRPVRARARVHTTTLAATRRRRRHRGRADYFEYFHSLPAEVAELERDRRPVRSRRFDEEEEEDEDDDGEGVLAAHSRRGPHRHAEERRDHRRQVHKDESEDDEEEEPAAPVRAVRTRSQAEERAIQRFVERALRNYDHSRL